MARAKTHRPRKGAIRDAKNEEFTGRVVHKVEEACRLVEVGFEYVTGDYHNGGKIFRKRK